MNRACCPTGIVARERSARFAFPAVIGQHHQRVKPNRKAAMIAIQERPETTETSLLSPSETKLCVERTDITFEDVAKDLVRIQVTIHNPGAHLSRRTFIRLEAAPLGAFVPWRPLSVLPVPALEPGESRDLSVKLPRLRPAPLGDFNRIPPQKLITAINSSDQPVSPSGNAFQAILRLLARGPAGGRPTAKTTSLPPDLWDWVGRGQPHWAGNINVFIGTRPVERHMAKALRVYAGRTNLAMFVVGERTKPDAYAFELVGLAPDWKAALYDASNQQSLMADASRPPIQPSQWLESNGGLVMLATRPPAGCEAGNLQVHVTRRSSGKTAIVEFDLDPSAQGAGCYVV